MNKDKIKTKEVWSANGWYLFFGIVSVLIICMTFGLLILPLHIVIVLSFIHKNLLYLTKLDIKQNNPTSILIKEKSVANMLYASKTHALININEIGAKKLKREYKIFVLVFNLITLLFSMLSISYWLTSNLLACR